MARRQMPKNDEEYKRYKEEREERGLPSLDSPTETPYGAPTERANLRNPYSGYGNTSLTMPKNAEEYRRYRMRKEAERNNQKWDARSDLRTRRNELENAAPTATGNLDAEWAGYYAALRNYGAAYGDKASYDKGFAGYNAAMDRVRGQYDSHAARHLETDKMVDERIARTSGMQGAGNRMTDADRRFVRDAALYNRMGKDANTAGDYALYQRAAKGYNKTVSDHATNYGQAQSDYWNAAKTEQPGYYYAQTMSADEVDAKLEELRATREKLHENLMGVLSDIDNNPHTPEERQRLSDTKYRIQDRYTNINNEIDYLETAKGLHKQRRGDDMYNYWLNKGGLEKPENYAKVEQGKAKYEADQLAASGGTKEPEIATPAGGVIKAYRNRNQKENEWDPIFDTAANLTPSDEMVFYALYADDPEQAMEWAYYINNRRNSEFQGEMAEWGHEHPGWAWLGGLGNRMISGVANFVDPNSAFAQKQSLQSTGLMSGGAQALNEWSGTIDTDIPIIRDLFNGKGAGDFYQLASSIVESGINMAVASYTGDAAKLVGALGTFIMGSSAAAADYNESLQRGLTTAQAQRHALAAGINEAAFEFISLDKVIKADKLAGQLKKVFVDAGIEASEEFCTTVANRVADGYLARTDGYDTQVEQRTKELIALGLSRADAEAQAEKEWRVELINDAIGGFISGGFHSFIEWGGGKVANKIATNQNNEIAGVWTDADEIAALRAYADENGIKYNEKALQGMEAVETDESGRQSASPTTDDGGQQTTVSTETRDAESSPTAQNDNQNNNEETAEKKQSRREARQERKSNRATGALQTQVESHIAKAAHESGLNNAQAFFEQTVSRYGEGITRTAQNAVAHEARSVFGQASNQSELTELYQKAVEGVTAQPVKQALQKVYDAATVMQYQKGDEGAKSRLIQQIGNTGRQFNTTVVLQNEDGTERSAKITDVLPGAERVKLDNGETVAVRDLAGIDADTKDILDMIGRLEIGSAADMLWKSFKVEAGSRTSSENSRYILDWTQAFDQGRTNTITMEEAVRRSSLDKSTVEQAYKLGQQERATMDKAKEERLAKAREQAKKGFTGKKGILDDTGVSKHALDRAMQNDSTLKEQIKMAEVIAEALGVDIKLFNSFDKKTWHGTENGSYNAATNTIMLDINAGKTAANDFTSGLLAVCGHELTHWMETFAFEAYGKYKDAVVQYIVQAYGKDGLNKLIHEQQERNRNLSRDEAIDEIVADASMDRMGDKAFWQAVAENLGEDRTEVRGKIAQFFDKYLGKIKEALGTKQVFMSRVNVARLEKQMQDALSALYAEGIREAAKNRKALTGTGTETKNAATGRLVNTAEEGKAAYDAYNDNLADILDRMSKTGDRFDTADALIEILQHAKTEDAIYRYMERELKDWYNVSRELAHDIYKLIGQINELPMEYFEGKTYDAVSFDETAAVVVPDTISADLKQQLIDAGANVIEYKAGDNEDRLAKVNSAENVQFSTRDTSLPSDLDLALSAADKIVAGGGDEYWASLLESDPGIAGEAEEIKRLGKQLKKTEADLEEARRNLTLTDRKLKTRGIASLAATIMQDQKAGDINHNDVQKRITAVLTEAYQKALDQLDAGADVSDAWETVYQEGVVKAADILLTDATHSEKISYKWYVKTLGEYLGEGAREYVEADIAARVAQDFDANRYRPGQKATVADRLVAQAENRVSKKLDAAKTENAALKAENAKLTETKDFYKEQAETAKATAGELYQQLLDKREELKNNKKISADERKATLKKLDNMTRQMQAKRREAEVWKSKSEIGWKAANQAIREEEAAVAKLEKQLQREQNILSGKLKPPAIQKMLKAAREREAERVAQQKDERFAKYKEGKKASDLRKRIKNLSDDMKRTMVKPTDGSYVPASLYGSMTKLADALDDFLAPNDGTKAASRYRAVMDKIHALSSEYQAVATLDDPVYSSEYDEEIQHEINELVRTLQGANADEVGTINMTPAKARELSVDELQKVYDIMKYINYCMKNAKSMMASGTFRSVYAAMDAVAKQQREIKPLNEIGKHEAGKRERILNKLSTMRAVEMMSGWNRESALYQLMRGIEQGTMDANAWVMFYDKTMQPLKNGKNELEYRQAVSKKMDYGATDERGNKVLMTKMQALQILMTAEREAHNDKLVHLQRGGAVIRDLKAKRNYRINVTPDLLQKIQNSLTEWDKSYMKTVRDYFQREGKRTNEILYKLRHRVLQTEKYYMPYYVDKDYLETKLDKPEAAMQMWAKVPGSVNALAKNASQSVYIDGMDTVMNQHVKEISNYIGLALAIRDFAKVYNGMIRQGDGEKPLPVKQTINDNFESGSKLLTQAVIDVQGGRKPKEHRTQLGKTLEKLQSAFYRKSLLINMGVTIKQAASYVAAESILDHRAIIAGNRPVFVGADKSHSPSLIAHLFMTPSGKTAQRIFNEIDEHTPLHWQRRQGMSMQELAEASASDGAIKSKLGMLGARMEQSKIGHAARMVTESLDPLNWIQRMDVATTATLWVACKEQARMDGMKVGTEEYWNHVTELYERVITETQPMYDTLHRSEDQKDRNGLMQYLFPFRTVPIQNHGQLVASYETMLAARKSGDKARIEAATRFARKTAVAQAMSAAIFATFTLFAQAMKRKTKKYRDEDEELTLGSLGLGVSKDVVGTLFSVFFPMYGSMVWDSVNTGIDYAKTGKNAFSYNSFSIGVVDMLNDIQKNGSDLAKDMIDLFAGRDVDKDKTISHIGKLVTSGLECFGVPVSTAVSYWNGIKGNVEDLANGRIPALNDASWERSNATNTRRLIKALEAGDEAKAEAVMEEMRQNILKDKPNLKADKVNAKIQSAVQSYVKQQYLADEMSEEKAIHYMVEYGSADDGNDAFWKIREWEAREAWDGEADDFSFSKYTKLREIIDNVGDISEEMQYLQDHGVKFDDANKEIKSYIGKQLKAGEYDEDEAMKTLQAYHKVKDEKTKQYRPDTEDEAWLAVKEWKANAEHADDEDYSWNKYEDLFAAMDKGGDIEPHADELESHGIKNDSIKNAVVDHVKERYEAGEVNASEAMRLLQKYRGMDANEAYWKVDEWDAKEAAYNAGEEFTNSNYRDLYAAIDANKDASAAINELTAHGYKERDVYSAAKDHLVERFEKGEINETQFKNQLSRYAKIVKQEDVDPIVNNAKCYKETGYRLGSLNESYLDGEITAEKFKQIRVKYGGKTAEEAKKQIRWLDLKKANPNLDITESVSNNWYDGTTKTRENGHESSKAAGMSIEAYLKAKATLDAIKDSNDNGTGEDEVIAAIAKMNLSARQKDALYYERYKGGARKGIYKTW